jgi:tripeptide aminopeptidase
VTASGTTLLGADDKAGVAIVMAMARHLLQNPEIPTARSASASRPTRRSAAAFTNLPADLGPYFAYTLDGAAPGRDRLRDLLGRRGERHVKGVSIHPGWAKDKLVNALHLAAKIMDTLPQATLTPETTAGARASSTSTA